ncbi:hypothetical protein B0T25DRAFT_226120 [Lasiosphaeria hispida]|uniref:Uncharacterized protein n=1 Tax=Lasiosphaeria hispida TaxID=260671 RepID=A0AAJ0HDF9_9PEZI|nr:hypothetical protein B0T25DRAFT_226120 [Lasiosphaeria hispida]
MSYIVHCIAPICSPPRESAAVVALGMGHGDESRGHTHCLRSSSANCQCASFGCKLAGSWRTCARAASRSWCHSCRASQAGCGQAAAVAISRMAPRYLNTWTVPTSHSCSRAPPRLGPSGGFLGVPGLRPSLEHARPLPMLPQSLPYFLSHPSPRPGSIFATCSHPPCLSPAARLVRSSAVYSPVPSMGWGARSPQSTPTRYLSHYTPSTYFPTLRRSESLHEASMGSWCSHEGDSFLHFASGQCLKAVLP